MQTPIKLFYALKIDGRLLFKYSWIPEDFDELLFSSLIGAIFNLGQEAGSKPIRKMDLEDMKISYNVDEKSGTIFAIGTASEFPDDIISDFMNEAKEKFISQYRNVLEDWDGNAQIFESFKPIIEELAKNAINTLEKNRLPVSAATIFMDGTELDPADPSEELAAIYMWVDNKIKSELKSNRKGIKIKSFSKVLFPFVSLPLSEYRIMLSGQKGYFKQEFKYLKLPEPKKAAEVLEKCLNTDLEKFQGFSECHDPFNEVKEEIEVIEDALDEMILRNNLFKKTIRTQKSDSAYKLPINNADKHSEYVKKMIKVISETAESKRREREIGRIIQKFIDRWNEYLNEEREKLVSSLEEEQIKLEEEISREIDKIDANLEQELLILSGELFSEQEIKMIELVSQLGDEIEKETKALRLSSLNQYLKGEKNKLEKLEELIKKYRQNLADWRKQTDDIIEQITKLKTETAKIRKSKDEKTVRKEAEKAKEKLIKKRDAFEKEKLERIKKFDEFRKSIVVELAYFKHRVDDIRNEVLNTATFLKNYLRFSSEISIFDTIYIPFYVITVTLKNKEHLFVAPPLRQTLSNSNAAFPFTSIGKRFTDLAKALRRYILNKDNIEIRHKIESLSIIDRPKSQVMIYEGLAALEERGIIPSELHKDLHSALIQYLQK